MSTAYDFAPRAADGTSAPLDAYCGKVLLIVNVASKCGFTPQYTGLEALQRKYAGRGLEVLGFPCNQFGAQEPGDAAEIASFCSLTYEVSFPVLAKIEVNGEKADPLYAFLKSEKPGLLGTEAIKWNFTKFLVGRDGQVAGRYAPTVKPEALESEIERLLEG
ncbi:glutathione peroxidase [Caulobacter sp. S45]|uniref:glutathione peroxidase n=1 Tax=Caulobacter sp. S45 TaxID=1641861 RepID=UPI00157654D4|nr:glutathione peroxidase [Caulobacter sp. S45]